MKKYIFLLAVFLAVICCYPNVVVGEQEVESETCETTEPVRLEEVNHQVAIQTVEEVEAELICEPIKIDAEDTYIPEEYQRYCVEIGEIYNICPELLMAMMERESSGRKNASNSAGDSGLLQVNPKWHYDRMERFGVTDLYDPYSNILVAADYLAELFKQNGDLYLVLMKYNMVHSTAEDLFEKGVYSEYAIEVSERAWELETLHEQEGE